MAQGDNIIIDVLGNTRPLEKQIAKVANTALTLNAKGFSQPLGRINGQLGEFEKSLAASNARVIAFGASAGAIFAVQKAFADTIRSVINVEKALTDINVILNVSTKSLASFGNSLFDIAKNTGQSFDQVAAAATEFSRQGLGLEATLKRTSDALILTRLTGLNVVDSVESITAALNSFNKTTITSNQLINKLAAVDAAFAVSSADLAQAISRVGSSAQDAGVSLDELIALVTSAQQTTARGGAVIGNSFKTIFTRLQRTDTLDALESIGVATKDQAGNILPLVTILNGLSNTYSRLNDVQRAQVAELVGGVFQINILKAALSDLSNEYSIYGRAVQTSLGATDEANRRNEELNQTLNATINKTLANLQRLASEAGNIAIAPTLKNLLGGLNSLLESFQPESEDIGSRIGQGLLKGIGTFLGGPGVLLAAAALFKIFERLVSFSADAFKTLTGLNAKTAEQQALQTQILNLISKNPQIIEQINSGNVNTANLHKQILSLIEQETLAMQRQLSIAATLSKSLMASGVRVAQTGPMRGVPTKALGFVPNFSAGAEVAGALAGGYMPGKIKQTFIPNYGMVTYNSAEKVKKFSGFNQPAIMPPQESKAGKNYRKSFEQAHGFNPYAWNGYVPNFAQISPGTSLESAIASGRYNRAALSKAFGKQAVEGALGPSKKPAAQKVLGVGRDFSVLNLANSDFDQIAGKELAKAIQSIAIKLIKPSTKKLPDANTIIKQLEGDTSAYPQILGRLFESAINASIELDLAKKAGGGGGTWDYIGSNFKTDNVNQSLFGGQLAAMQALPFIDAKLNASTAGGSIKGKIQRTPQLKKALIEAFRSGQQIVNLPYGVIKSKGQSKPIAFSQEDLASSGFIPNFSALREAISREVSAGVPASSIRVGSSSSLMSSKNPLGLGVYNTKDEPLGLNQGINRFSSKREAKMAGAANGYVPNFAIMQRGIGGLNIDPTLRALTSLKDGALNLGTKLKTLSTSVSKVKVYFDDNALPQSIQKYKGNLIQASIGLSLASGLLQEATKNSPRLSQAIENFSSTLSLAGTAASILPGKFGIFGAALIGLTGALSTISDLLKDNSTKFKDASEKATENLTEFSNGSQKYAETLQKLEQAQADPKTSARTLQAINEDLVKAAQEIPSAYRKQLVSITNYTDLLNKISQVQSELNLEEKSAKILDEFSASINKRTGGYFARNFEAASLKALYSPGTSIGGGLGVFGGGQILDPKSLDRFSKELGKSAFTSPEAREALKERLTGGGLYGGIDIRQAATSPEYLKSFGFSQDLIDQIKKISSQRLRAGLNPFSRQQGITEAEGLIGRILTSIQEEIVDAEELDKLQEKRNKEKDLIDKDNAEKQRAIDLEKSRQDALDNFYQKLFEIGDVQAEFRDKLGFDQRDLQLQRASGLLGYSRGSMGAQASREYEFNLENSKRQLEFSQKLREQESEARKKVLSEGYKVFLDLRKENVPGQVQKVDPAVLNAFQQQLGQLAVSGKSAEQINQEIISAFNSYFGSTQYGNKAIDLQSQTNTILGDNQRALLNLVADQKKQNDLAKINNEIQKATIQRQRDTRAFGGLQSYVSPQGNQTLESITTNIAGLRGPTGGRAAAGVLLDTVQLFGGDLEGVKLGGLKEQAIAGRAQDIQFQTSSISRLLRGQGQISLADEYTKLGGRANEIARTQVDEAIQSQKSILNIDNNVSTISKNFQTLIQTVQGGQNTLPQLSTTSNLQNLNPNLFNQVASQANNLVQQNRTSEVTLKNTDLALNGNVSVNINSQPIEFTIDTASVENIKTDISTQIQGSLETLRQDLETQIKGLESSVNQRIVALGGQRLPPTK
jgi:TP901 family phage tail tape measure protein